MGALSNLYFNNIGYNGTGYVGDNFASTMNMMFNGVNGVSIFGCGYPGFGDLGGGFCPNNNAYWGMQAGLAGFNIFTNIVTARIGNHRAAKAEAKAQDAKDNQSYEDALKTLGLNDKTAEEITEEDIETYYNEAIKEENLIKQDTAVSKAKTVKDDAERAFNKVEKEVNDNLAAAVAKYDSAKSKYEELRNKQINGDNSVTEAQVKAAKDAMDEAEKAKKELELKQVSIEEGGELYKKRAKAQDDYTKTLETAKRNIDNAQRIAKEYLPKAQAKAKEDLNKCLDDADGTVASRMWSKNVVQDDNGDYTNNNLAEYTKYDWQKLLYAYRKGNSTVRSQIKTMLNDNENCIKNSKEITTGQQALVESILGKKIFDNE